ncbi:MAG: FAD:protein FMN transferase [Nitrospirae bacterium]|nr:FAD:protein FMN transferase [Nitrospirota bacterium]
MLNIASIKKLQIILILILLINSCSRQPEQKIYKKFRILMDTIITITVVSPSEKEAETAINNAFSVIERLDKSLSSFSPDSDVSKINHSAGIDFVKVSTDTYQLINAAIKSAQISDGAFDPTIGPLVNLWDIADIIKPDAHISPKLPALNKIKEKLMFVNYKDIIVDDHDMSIKLRKKGMAIDLGGIAKGYAADKAVAALKASGIKSGIVSCAGDLKVFGNKPDNSNWLVGIRAPRGKLDDLIAVLSLKDLAVSTSGDYERFFIINGIRYHHILDPKTGYPANGFQSVTLVNEQGIITDGLDTAVFVLGPKKGLELVNKMGLMAYFVYSDGSIYITDNLKKLIVPNDKKN